MKSTRMLTAVSAALTFGVLLCGAASAQPEWIEQTKVSFATPVHVPGMVLPPGTYTLRLANPEGGRNIVHIFDETGQRLITTLVTIPKQRLEPTGDLFLELAESADGEPPALKAYFYPGKTIGHEFVYGTDEAQRLATRTRQEILAGNLNANDKESWNKGAVTRVKPKQ